MDYCLLAKEEYDMNIKPSSIQCAVARLMTNSTASDDVITHELNSVTEKEWNEMCLVLDSILKKHDDPFDKGKTMMVADFVNVGAANGVNEATLFIAYMNWKSK